MAAIRIRVMEALSLLGPGGNGGTVFNGTRRYNQRHYPWAPEVNRSKGTKFHCG